MAMDFLKRKRFQSFFGKRNISPSRMKCPILILMFEAFTYNDFEQGRKKIERLAKSLVAIYHSSTKLKSHSYIKKDIKNFREKELLKLLEN